MEKRRESVNAAEFAETLGLEIISKGEDYLEFSTININRPGMQLHGFYEHFPTDRVQIMGEMEFAYLSGLAEKKRLQALDKFFSYKTPCTIISTGLEAMPELLVSAEKYSRPLFRSKLKTTPLSNNVLHYLGELLAPTTTQHGVFMDVFGIGLMIVGSSGVGKSETALELVQRGHRLVADDAVIIRQIGDRLIGTSPEIIRYFMEVRGIGIVDVRNMYGVGAVKTAQSIDLVVQLEQWDNNKEYDRLGIEQDSTEILGIKVPLICLPIKPGRNTAVLLEVAARNQRLKSIGYFAAEELIKKAEGKN